MITFDRLYYAGQIEIDPSTVITVRGEEENGYTTLLLLGGARVRVVGCVSVVKAALGISDIPPDDVPTL